MTLYYSLVSIYSPLLRVRAVPACLLGWAGDVVVPESTPG